MGKVSAGKLIPDTALASAVYSKEMLDLTKAIVVGHGHYDHVMDLPSLANRLPLDVKVFCNKSVQNMLASTLLKPNLINAETSSGNYTKTGEWLYSTDSSVRIMAFESAHLPHFLGITLYGGQAANHLKQLPTKAKEWKMGKPLTFLIDFMQANKPVCRIFAQSTSCKDSVGLFPKMLLTEKAVDICFNAIPSSKSRIDYVVRTLHYIQPKIAFINHWENFFKPYLSMKKPKGIAKANVGYAYKIIQQECGNASRIILPKPRSRFILVGQ